MLKAASYLLQTLVAIALACALVVRARTRPFAQTPNAITPTVHADLRTAEMHWIGDDRGWDWDMPVHKDASIHKEFSVAAAGGHRAIEVDNIFGSIEVSGGNGDGVQMDVDKTLHAQSNQALDRAEKDVTLDIEQESGLLKIAVKYPSRCAWGDCWNFDDHTYAVEMNFRLQVPRESDLTLKTVDGPEVRVHGVSGTFSISNVNGGITMDDISGSGSARTVNGPIKVTFRQNPRSDSQFSSVNGGVDLYFAKNLSADFKFRTFSGNVYSDFPVLSAPVSVPDEERHGMKYYFRTNASGGGRVGAGGPLIHVENLNGDIRILEKHE
jgi:hypothetical protein